jgi:hypothetical protein
MITLEIAGTGAVSVDGRFKVVIERHTAPPMASAQLVLRIYPITDGEVWDESYEVFAVDEDRLVGRRAQFHFCLDLSIKMSRAPTSPMLRL